MNSGAGCQPALFRQISNLPHYLMFYLAPASYRKGRLLSGIVDETDWTGNTHAAKEIGIPTN